MKKAVALKGSKSDHGGYIKTVPKVGVLVEGKEVAVEAPGCMHYCPKGDPPHGLTPIKAITTKTRIKGFKVITVGAVAGCGAKIIKAGSAIRTFAE